MLAIMHRKRYFTEIINYLVTLDKNDGNIEHTAMNLSMKPAKFYQMIMRFRKERAVWRLKENNVLALITSHKRLKRVLEPTRKDILYAKRIITMNEQKVLEIDINEKDIETSPDQANYILTNVGTIREDIALRMIRSGKAKALNKNDVIEAKKRQENEMKNFEKNIRGKN